MTGNIDWDYLFVEAARSIRAGGKEPLYSPPFLPCGSETHEPFRLAEQPFQIPLEEIASPLTPVVWGMVRTSSWQFSGERTDLHDVWSLCWAAFLRAAGIASPWLFDEEGWCGPMELSGRQLFIQPVSWGLDDEKAFDRVYKALSAWTAFAYHLFDSIFDWEGAANDHSGNVWDKRGQEEKWAQAVLKSLRHPKEYTASKRTLPSWLYFSALPRGVTIVQFSKQDMDALKFVLGSYRPNAVNGENALAVFSNGIVNGVPFKSITLAKRLMKKAGDPENSPLILPIDSHCLFFGKQTLIAVRENCGHTVYEAERELFLRRRASEDHVFFGNSRVDWLVPLDAGEFESLCVDILRREPAVVRAKPVGGLNDRDGGRDILIDWIVPSHRLENEKRTIKIRRILAQVKTRKRPVGKGDVRDIRDTVERYDAHGYMLVAHPRLTAYLVDFLEDLRTKSEFMVDWWEMRDLESRLRRNPDIARRYPKLVKLCIDDSV